MSPKPASTHGKFRLFWRIGLYLSLAIFGVLGLVVVSLNLPFARNIIRQQLNHALAETFTGQLLIDRIGSLRLDAVAGIDARVLDSQHRQVVDARGLRVRSNWPELVLALVRGRPATLRLVPASVDHVEITLIDDGSGLPTLASAFNPRHPSPPTKKQGSSLTVDIGELEMKHVWAHGGLSSVPVIDAEVSGLKGSFKFAQSGLTLKINNTKIQARSAPAQVDPTGSLSASLNLPLDERNRNRVVVDYAGQLAAAPVTIHAELDGNSVNATLDASHVPPSAVKARLQSSSLEQPVSLHAHVHGQLPKLEAESSLVSEAGTLSLRGQAELSEPVTASAELAASDVNLGPVLGLTERTQLSGTASLRVESRKSGALHAAAKAHIAQGLFSAAATPKIDIEGALDKNAAGELALEGTVGVKEPGAPLFARYSLRAPTRGEPTLQATFELPIHNPPRLRTLAGVVASGKVTGGAEYKLLSRQILAHASASLRPVGQSRVSARTFDAAITASGRVDAPVLRMVAEANDIQADQRRFKQAHLEVTGTPRRAHVDGLITTPNGNSMALSTDVLTQKAVLLETPRVSLKDNAGEVVVRADRVAMQNGSIEVVGLVSTGAGELHASGKLDRSRMAAQFSVEQLDLGRLSRAIGIRFAESGKLSATGKLAGALDSPSGRIYGSASDVTVANLRRGQLAFDLESQDRKLNGSIESRIGRSNVQVLLRDLTVSNATSIKGLLRDTRGSLELAGVISLAEFQSLLRRVGLPIESAGGEANVALRFQNLDSTPQDSKVHLALKTQHLHLVEQRKAKVDPKSPSQAREAEPRALEGVDLDVECDFDPVADKALARLRLLDSRGAFLTVDAESKAPRFFSSELQSQLQDLPFKLVVRAPERDMKQLPRLIRPAVMRGLLAFDLEAEGTIANPHATAHLSVRQLKSRDGRNYVNLQADTQYENSGGSFGVYARSTRGGVAEVRSAWTGDLAQRVRNPSDGTSVPFELKADLALREFPVGIIPQLSDRQVRGSLSGDMHLTGLGRDARLDARIDASGVSVNRVRLTGLNAQLNADGRAVSAVLDIAQAQGSAHAELSTPEIWGSRLVPELDPRAHIEFTAKEFQLGMLSPFALQYVSTIEGRLNAQVSARFGDAAPEITGTLSVNDGVIQIPTIGQRFSDVKLKAAIHDGAIEVSSLSARGITGRVTAQAKAELVATQLAKVSAQLDIRENEKLPVTFEGANIGDAWGHIDFSYSQPKAEAPKEIRVDVPRLTLKMPETAQASVQELSAASNVRIGAHRSDGRFVEIPLQPLGSATAEGEPPQLTRIFVHLGDAVWVERDRQVRVQLSGNLEIDSGEKQQYQGRIELRGGKLDVSGKQFEIERGVVTLEGPDPSNPTITATARWDSPANYTVYADYAGTVKQGQLKLYSDPSLSQDEILSLILFGSPDGSIASSSNSNGAIGNIVNGSPNGSAGNSSNGGPTGASAAVGVAGSTATQGLNRAISDVTNLDVSTRIDTSTGSARPELVVQLTPRLTTRVTRALGEPAPGESPDRTFLTLELRLKRAWSLSAIVGDHGASTLDLIWRKRY